MNKVEYIMIIVIFLIVYGCGRKSTQTVIETNDSLARSEKSDVELLDTILLQFTDTLHNPFLTDVDYTELKEASNSLSLEQRFEAIVKQFLNINIPSAFGPKPESYTNSNAIIKDSLFNVDCMEDKFMYQSYPDVMSYYSKGRIVDETANYKLIVFLHYYSAGFDYQLYSFTHKGKLISKANIGGEGPDWYEDYGIIDDKKNFRVLHKEYDKENWRNMTLKWTKTTKYSIMDNGEFVIVK